jgi:hypothetical protein
MLVHFIKHLVRITSRRNSFYVTLGLSRLLHNYSTSETMEIYNVVVQDPGRVRDDYYYRSRKGVLMKELKERFGDRLSITRGARGEERFQIDDRPGQHAELARECLLAFTPWNTDCAIPANIDPLSDEIRALSFDGSDPDREHAIEVNRFHTVLHPDCFTRLATSLHFAAPAERLAPPYFSMSKERNRDHDQDPPRRSRRAPKLDEAELDAIQSLLAEQSSRRKTASVGLLRVIVDGSERARLDPVQGSLARFDVTEKDELIEVRAADGLLLATRLLDYDDLSRDNHHRQSSTTLEDGQELSFTVVHEGGRTDDIAGATIELSYRETLPSRVAALYLRRLRFTVGNFWRSPVRVAWKPALAFTTLLIVVLGLMVYWIGHRRPQEQQALGGDPSTPRKQSPAPQSPKPNLSPSHQIQIGPDNNDREKRTPSAPRTPVSGPSTPEAPTLVQTPPRPSEPVDPELRPEVDPVVRSASGSTFDGAALLGVKKVHVDPFGSDDLSQQFRDQLNAALRTNRRFTLTTNRDDADAVLKGRLTPTRGDQVTLTVRMVNAKGDVIWPVKGSSIGKQYQGSIVTIAGHIARDLLADMQKAQRK